MPDAAQIAVMQGFVDGGGERSGDQKRLIETSMSEPAAMEGDRNNKVRVAHRVVVQCRGKPTAKQPGGRHVAMIFEGVDYCAGCVAEFDSGHRRVESQCSCATELTILAGRGLAGMSTAGAGLSLQNAHGFEASVTEIFIGAVRKWLGAVEAVGGIQ